MSWTLVVLSCLATLRSVLYLHQDVVLVPSSNLFVGTSSGQLQGSKAATQHQNFKSMPTSKLLPAQKLTSPQSGNHAEDLSSFQRKNNPTPQSLSKLAFPLFQPQKYYLGVLVDAGRFHFDLDWLYFFIDTLYTLGYNYLHLRLTDDQRMAVKWEFDSDSTHFSFLATAAKQQQKEQQQQQQQQLYYTPDELKRFVQYAKAHNVTVIPEINVPGHGGAWAEISNQLVVSCPEFTCRKGYGLLLNVTHTHALAIVKSVLEQVIEIFQRPPFLHLGGDEVFMAEPCLQEAGIPVEKWHQNIEKFERDLTTIVVKDLGYDPASILRWETRNISQFYRTGSMTHYWETVPRYDHKHDNNYSPWIASTGLYFDQIRPDAHGWGDYQRTRQLLDDRPPQALPKAVVVGTFELSMEYWIDRNVLGRLLAVTMAASSSTLRATINDVSSPSKNVSTSSTTTTTTSTTESEFRQQYARYCQEELGWDPALCRLVGNPSLDAKSFGTKWKTQWKEWRQQVCDRLTYSTLEPRIIFNSNKGATLTLAGLRRANEYYWQEFVVAPQQNELHDAVEKQSIPPKRSEQSSLVLLPRPHVIKYTGIILDLVEDLVPLAQLQEWFQILESLGFNLVQLRLASDRGTVVDWESVPDLGYISKDDRTLYTRQDLQDMAKGAQQAGLEILPEISFTTNAGGWYKTGVLVNCPKVLCEQGNGIAHNVQANATEILPIVLAVIQEARQVFSTNGKFTYLHLGHDERQASMACLSEAGIVTSITPSDLFWNRFERKLSAALAMQAVDLNKILRWDNGEHIRYPIRAGSITQYSERNRSKISKDESFFGTMTLEDATPWEIFEDTREWVKMSPVGLMAQARPSAPHTSAHLVAFALGLASAENLRRSAFWERHRQLCLRLLGGCDDGTSQRVPMTEEDLATSCLDRTVNVAVRKTIPDAAPFQEL